MVVSNPAKLSSVIAEFGGGNCLSGNITEQGDGLTCLSQFAGLEAGGDAVCTTLAGPPSGTFTIGLSIRGHIRQQLSAAEQLACAQAEGFSVPPTFTSSYTVNPANCHGSYSGGTQRAQILSTHTDIPVLTTGLYAGGRPRFQMDWWNYSVGDFNFPMFLSMWDESNWNFTDYDFDGNEGDADTFTSTAQTAPPGNTHITPGTGSAPEWFTSITITDHMGRGLEVPANQFNYIGNGLGSTTALNAKRVAPPSRSWGWYPQSDADWNAFNVDPANPFNPSLSGGAKGDNRGIVVNPGDFQWADCTICFNGYGAA